MSGEQNQTLCYFKQLYCIELILLSLDLLTALHIVLRGSLAIFQQVERTSRDKKLLNN
jgi:hypothetical protein